MARVTLLQKMKPLIRYFILLLPLALLVILFSSGSSTFTGVQAAENILATSATNNLRLAVSSKYEAGVVDGINNSDDAKVVSGRLFSSMVATARQHPRKRKMTDLTKDPTTNSMQTLMNTWIEGSYSPVHYHDQYSEVGIAVICNGVTHIDDI